MARVEIASLAWGWIADANGNGLGGRTVRIQTLTGAPATHWSAVTGGTSSTAAIISNSDGTIGRYIDEGTYDIYVDGAPEGRVEVVSGSTVLVVPVATGVAATDRAAIQVQLDAARAVGGKVVQLSEGTYAIDAALLVGSNTVLRGSGSRTILAISGNVNGIANYDGVSGNTGIVIENLQINGTGTSGSPFQKGIRLDATTDSVIRGVTVYNTYLQGINLDDCDRVRIVTNLVKESWGNGISLDNGCTDCVVEGNHIIDARDSGIGVHKNCTGVIVSGNTVRHTLATRIAADDGGVFGYGVDVFGSPGTIVVGNYLHSTANHAIYVHTWTSGGTFAPDRCVIKGNVIIQPRSRPGPLTPGDSDGIQIFATADDQIHNCVVNGNMIYDPAGHGIYVGNGVNTCSYVGNNISLAIDGMRFEGGVNGLPYRSVVTGNLIRSCSGLGINVTHASSAEFLITANYLMSNTGGQLSVATVGANMVGPNSNSAGNALELFCGLVFSAQQTAASANTKTLFVDSADGKLKYKDSGGVINALY